MIIEVDTTSAVPPYEQVRAAIEQAVTDGALAPGARVPTVRALAANLGLAPNTVARAYRELEVMGLLRAEGRRGTFVAERAPVAVRAARDAAESFAEHVHRLGVSPEMALSLARDALGRRAAASRITSTTGPSAGRRRGRSRRR